VTAPADERDLAHDAARRGGRAVAEQLQVAAALNAGRGACLLVDDRCRCDVDGPFRRAAWQLSCEPLRATNHLPQRALLLASGAAGARRARHDFVSHVRTATSTAAVKRDTKSQALLRLWAGPRFDGAFLQFARAHRRLVTPPRQPSLADPRFLAYRPPRRPNRARAGRCSVPARLSCCSMRCARRSRADRDGRTEYRGARA